MTERVIPKDSSPPLTMAEVDEMMESHNTMNADFKGKLDLDAIEARVKIVSIYPIIRTDIRALIRRVRELEEYAEFINDKIVDMLELAKHKEQSNEHTK